MSGIDPSTQYGVGPVPYHVHSGTDSPQVDISNIEGFPSSPSNNDLVVWSAADGKWVSLAVGTTGTFLKSQGTGANLTWSAFNGSYFGTGSDGNLTLTGGTHSESLNGASIYVKNYASISITSTANLTYSSPANTGTLIVWRVQGDVVITSTASPVLDLANLGGQGGALVSGVNLTGNNGGSFGSWGFAGSISGGGGGSETGGAIGEGGGGGASMGTNGTAGGGPGGAGGTALTYLPNSLSGGFMFWPCVPGSGGGSGGTGNPTGTSGVGGNGAGSLLILCGGKLTVSSSFHASGANGGNGSANGGGGGGGGAGSVVMLYNTLVSNTGSLTANGGSGGTGSNSGGAGAGNGLYVVSQNYIF